MFTPRPAAAAAVLLSLALALAGAARAQIDDPLFEVVTQGQGPIYVAHAGDGRLFIVERDGYVRIFASGTLQPRASAFLDIDALVSAAGEGGLLSIAFDSDYATNRYFYVMYTRDSATPGVVLESVVARYSAMAGDPDHADPNSGTVLLTLDAPAGGEFTNHKGGQLQVGPDDMLYIGFGDGGSQNDPGCRSQTRNVFFGKILRVDPHGTGSGPSDIYSIPASNPFDGDPNYAPEIWALGLRNPWRFSFDREGGDLWIGDVGGGSQEEVDLQDAGSGGGQNYGWRVREGDGPGPGASGCPGYVGSAVFTDPIFAYPHTGGASITGGYVYRGALAPEWQGRYFYAEFIQGELRALRQNGSEYQSSLLHDDPAAGFASFGEGADGELYLADLYGGWVYRLRLDRISASKDATACVTKLNEGFGKLANSAAKASKSCVQKAATGKLAGTDVETCASSDPKLAKASDRNLSTEAKKCGEPPSFGYAGAEAGNSATLAAQAELMAAVFGADLDAAIALKAEDKDAAACQKAVLAGLLECQKARRAEFFACKKTGLKKQTVLNQDQLAACLSSDPKGKIARKCDAATGKLATKTIENSCSARGVDLSDVFPGCASDDPGALAQCLDGAGCLANCEMYDGADALGANCEALCD